ncbi:MAG TPA: acetyl-CoA carboxylase biotin carboxyl carrier protein [Pyrinomonadaceae bacterium]|nr:acetyl-CoA carboxylase biotin carboxyl carrier protein [Pyrinomonadaceae bacterium]
MTDQAAATQTSVDEQRQGTKQPEPGRRERDRGRRRHHPNQPRRPEPALNMDELRDLVELITAHGLTDFELEREGFRVRLRRELAPQSSASAPNVTTSAQMSVPPAQATASSAPSSESTAGQGATAAAHPVAQPVAASEDEDLHIITSPIVGTFYRAASPTAEPFVRLGSHVDPDTVVCIIEAMKLMNEIQAETSGEVVKIYVENGQPVEYGQPLFGIKK